MNECVGKSKMHLRAWKEGRALWTTCVVKTSFLYSFCGTQAPFSAALTRDRKVHFISRTWRAGLGARHTGTQAAHKGQSWPSQNKLWPSVEEHWSVWWQCVQSHRGVSCPWKIKILDYQKFQIICNNHSHHYHGWGFAVHAWAQG